MSREGPDFEVHSELPAVRRIETSLVTGSVPMQRACCLIPIEQHRDAVSINTCTDNSAKLADEARATNGSNSLILGSDGHFVCLLMHERLLFIVRALDRRGETAGAVPPHNRTYKGSTTGSGAWPGATS